MPNHFIRNGIIGIAIHNLKLFYIYIYILKTTARKEKEWTSNERTLRIKFVFTAIVDEIYCFSRQLIDAPCLCTFLFQFMPKKKRGLKNVSITELFFFNIIVYTSQDACCCRSENCFKFLFCSFSHWTY